MNHIIMLDCDSTLVSAVTRALAQEGMKVTSASDVREALARVSSEVFDAALLDGDMIDAEELARFAVVPVILTTSFSERAGGHRFSREARLLNKPFTSAQLLSALHKVCVALDPRSGSLVGLLRRANSAGQSVAFRVGAATVVVEQGELVHAELGGVVGERALVRVLAQSHHVPVVIPHRDVARTIQRPFRALMLELLERIEEQEQHGSRSDAPTGVRSTHRGTRS
jgi:DNA-binding response OmpR family regulator